ncbi:uncharacterized protein LOC143902221 isoform X4 [Temnothorax americanus]|uniref:uncharacterized protein LOC143902221 isoform X4 n=1 Tax=Temnothorax americanus TaxID=1964332 RepID=UPI0040680BDA
MSASRVIAPTKMRHRRRTEKRRRRPGRHRATAEQPRDQRRVTTYNSAVAHRPTALSIFFQEAAIPSCAQGAGTHFGQITPCNTPATPPNFPDTLLAFSKMSAGEKTPSGMSPSQNGFQVNSTPMASIVQHHAAGGRCSASGNTTQQQTQSQQTQFGLGEPQR